MDTTIDNLKVDGLTPKSPNGGQSRSISEKERKLMRDAFKLFDTDGDGSVTATELKHVMDTLFNTNITNDELEAMVKDVDTNGDGVVSFDEFADKIHAVITKLKDSDVSADSEGRKSTNHWESLSLLITKYTDENKMKEKPKRHDPRKLMMSKQQKQAKDTSREKSNQHNAMVAHFNLRRLSVDVDPDEMERAMKAMQEKESKLFKHRIKRPMHPHSTFRRLWEIVILVLVLFQAVYIPLTVSFRINHVTFSRWWRFDLATDILFMMDLIMTFNVAIISTQNKLILNRKVIAITYLKSWFLLDLAASVPFDLIIQGIEPDSEPSGENSAASATSLLKGFKLPRLLRLLKIMRLMRLVKMAKIRPEIVWWFQYSRHSNILRLVTLIVMILVIVHYITCMFFPIMEEVWLSRKDCEVYNLLEYEDYLYDLDDLDDPYTAGIPVESCTESINSNTTDPDYITIYATAFYNSMLLIQGEQIDPKTVGEKFYCSILILTGSLLLAMIFGNVSMYIANFSANSTAYQRKMEYLFESMNHLELPQQLKHRIIMYYDHIWKEYRSLDGRVHSFIPELSKQLESEVYLYLRTNLILSVPFLRQCSPEVVQRLVTILETQVCLPNDYIVHKGVPGEEMYLISRGVCEVTVNDFVSGGPAEDDGDDGIDSGSDGIDSLDDRSSAGSVRRSFSERVSLTKKLPGQKLAGRRRSSIVGAMTESLHAMKATLEEKNKTEKKGWKRPDRVQGGLLLENKTYSSTRTMETVPVSRESSNRKVGGGVLGALSPRFSKRERSVQETRKHSIDAIPSAVDMQRLLAVDQKGGKDGKVSASRAAVSPNDIDEGLSEHSSNDPLEKTIKAPSRVGNVESKVAFPLSKGFSSKRVASVAGGGGSGGEQRPSGMRRLSKMASGAVSSAVAGLTGGGTSESESEKEKEKKKKAEKKKSKLNRKESLGISNLIKTEKVVKELFEGDYFGEIALILNTTRTCNVRAKNFVELHILKREDFEEVVGKYAEERKLMEEIIMEKYKVEVSNLETKKRRDLKAEQEAINKMIKATNEGVQECRLVVETLQQQIALITQALIVSDVVKVGGNEKQSVEGAAKNSTRKLSKRVDLLMGGSLRSLQSQGSESKKDMLRKSQAAGNVDNKQPDSPNSALGSDNSKEVHKDVESGDVHAPLNMIKEKNKNESESRRESLVSVVSLPGSIPGLEGVEAGGAWGNEESKTDSNNDSGAMDSGRTMDSDRTIITGNKYVDTAMRKEKKVKGVKEVKEEEESFEDLVKSAGLEEDKKEEDDTPSGGDYKGE